jgi:hypothetical protein
MRSAVVPFVLIAALIAGCLGQGGPPPANAPPVAPSGSWARDCAISNWGDPCTAKATQTHGPANELMLAANPRDADNVVIGAKDYTPEGSDCVWAGTSVTHDGGRSWTNGWVGGGKQDRDPRLLAYDCVTDPVLDFAQDGTLYYLVEAYGIGEEATAGTPPTPLGGLGHGSTMFLAASLDGGDSWELRGVITAGPGGAVLLHDKSDMAVSRTTGTIVASWTAFNAAASQLLYTRSTDGGMTFSPPRALMSFDSAQQAQETTAMVDLDWDAEGQLHAVWFNWAAGELLYARSEDDGASFTTPIVVAPAAPWTGQDAPNSRFRIFDSPMIAVDLSDGPRRGWLYVTWADDLTVEDDHDLWFMRSEDGGASWAAPMHTVSEAGSDQFHPNLVVASDGSVHLFAYDRRYSPGNTLLDATHALSLDGGRNWTATRLSAGSFDGDLGIHQSGVPFMGDYNGIGSSGSAVYLTYADTREGRSDVAVAKFVLP